MTDHTRQMGEGDLHSAHTIFAPSRTGGASAGAQMMQDGDVLSGIREHMEVIGADGVHVGTVDHIDGDRIKLTKADSGAQISEGTGRHEGHHHYISRGLVAAIEGDKVRLSATAANAITLEEEA